MQPYLHARAGAYGHFLWNVSHSVGRGGANSSLADVSYIQWYFSLAVSFHKTPEHRKALYRKVRVTGRCTGRDDDPLVQAILALQEGMRPKHPEIDGLVSVARGDGKYRGRAYFVLRLGARLANMHPRLWPRLDLMPGCPASVAAASKAAVPSV